VAGRPMLHEFYGSCDKFGGGWDVGVGRGSVSVCAIAMES